MHKSQVGRKPQSLAIFEENLIRATGQGGPGPQISYIQHIGGPNTDKSTRRLEVNGMVPQQQKKQSLTQQMTKGPQNMVQQLNSQDPKLGQITTTN